MRIRCTPPLVGEVDGAEPSRHSGDGRREDDHDHERERRAVDDLEVLAELVEGHFVPYSRSPASPSPGTMNPRSFRPLSTAAQTTCTSG